PLTRGCRGSCKGVELQQLRNPWRVLALSPQTRTGEGMSPRSLISGGLAVAATVAMLALAGAAGAAKPPHAGELTFQQTYPHASRVCTEVAAGGGLKRLRPFAAQVAADCAALQAQFNTAHTTVLAQFAAIAAARAAQRAATTA